MYKKIVAFILCAFSALSTFMFLGCNDNSDEKGDDAVKNYNKIFTFSLDDGVASDARFIALLQKYNLTATFCINSGLLGTTDAPYHERFTEQQVRDGAYEGFEVASHTYSHPSLLKDVTDEAGIIAQVNGDVATIKNLTGQDVVGLAYPGPGLDPVTKSYDFTGANGLNTNARVIKIIKDNTDIKYARTINDTHTFSLPKDFMCWNPTCKFLDENLMTYAESFADIEPEDGENSLFYVWGHTYEFDIYNCWDKVEQFLKYMSENVEDAVCLTNSQVYELFKDKIVSGATKYVTMSFDDGTVYDGSIMNVLRRYGHTASFNINSGLLGSPIATPLGNVDRYSLNDILGSGEMGNPNGVYKGFELLAHGSFHAPGGFAVNGQINNTDIAYPLEGHGTMWDETSISFEMQQDAAYIGVITGKRVYGCAYPGGDVTLCDEVYDIIKNNTSLTFGRRTDITYNFAIPTDFMQWKFSTQFVARNSCTLLDQLMTSNSGELQLLSVWDHAWYMVHDATIMDEFEDFCEALESAKDVVCLSNAEIYLMFM